jgi:hypothetical protein
MVSNMFIYNIHGLIIKSQIEFPELEEAKTGDFDAVVTLGEFDPLLGEVLVEGYHFRVTSEAVYLFWEGIGSFMMKDGYELVVKPDPSVDEDYLRPFIFGPALAVLLHQKGVIVLHASAVDINGEAVAFLGDSGYGKSTLAVALQSLGHPMVTDDTLSVDVAEKITVNRGLPLLRLFDDVSEVFRDDPGVGEMLYRSPVKNFYQIHRWTEESSLKLKCIYVLEKTDEVSISPLKDTDGLLNLIKNSFLINIFRNHEKSQNLEQCFEIASKIPIKLLKTGNSLHDLDKLANLVEKDVIGN